MRIKRAYVPHPKCGHFNVDVFEAKMVTLASNNTCMTMIQKSGKWFNIACTIEKDSRLGLSQNNIASQISRLCLVLLSAHCDGHSRASEPCHGAQYAFHGVFFLKMPQPGISQSIRIRFNLNPHTTQRFRISDNRL